MTVHLPPGFANLTIGLFGPGGSNNKSVSVGWQVDTGMNFAGFLTNVENALIDAMQDAFLSNYTITDLTVVGPDTSEERSVNLIGGRDGEVAAPSTCYLVRKSTALRGVAHRGRVFLPGVLTDEDVDSDGSINPDILEDVRLRWVSFINQVESSTDWNAYLLHSSSSLDPDRIINWPVDPRIATQRRRLR